MSADEKVKAQSDRYRVTVTWWPTIVVDTPDGQTYTHASRSTADGDLRHLYGGDLRHLYARLDIDEEAMTDWAAVARVVGNETFEMCSDLARFVRGEMVGEPPEEPYPPHVAAAIMHALAVVAPRIGVS